MKKLSKVLLILALVATVFQPCEICLDLMKNGTKEELTEHIEKDHYGVSPYMDPHGPFEG